MDSILKIAVGTAVLGKGVTSGVRRSLGVRLEQHTTSVNHAKNIIKNGYILKPEYGGTGLSRITHDLQANSKGFVHVTGFHKTFFDTYEGNLLFGNFIDRANLREFCKQKTNSPSFNFFRLLYRKVQGKLYGILNSCDIPDAGNSSAPEMVPKLMKENFGTKKDGFKTIFDIITKRKIKTFYIGGTDEYFNENFLPNTHTIGLKTDKPLRVFKTKIGATLDALKRDGLKGMKQNKTRVVAGTLFAGACFLAGYKLIKNGVVGLKNNKEQRG